MKPTILLLPILALPLTLSADFSYDETTKITGGAIVGMMKFAGALSKDARKAMDPIVSTTAIHGNRMVHRTPDTIEIIDLDRETITRVHLQARTYSVITFEQMRQAMEDASKQMAAQAQKSNGNGNTNVTDLQYEVSLNETGQTRTYGGLPTREMIMIMKAKGTDAKSGQTGSIDIKTDMWIASDVPGYAEVREFHKRMATKLAYTPAGSPLAARPDIAKAMAELNREGSKLNGMPMYEVVSMLGTADNMPATTDSRPQQRQSSPPPTSVSDAVGGALAGRLGLGGLGRKKPKDQPATDSTTQDMPQSTSNPGALMEMTMEVTSHSQAPVDPSLLEVPSGFTQVQEDAITRPSRRTR